MPGAAHEFASGLYTQSAVVRALILRETKTRFGKYQLGYLWALLEPLLWMGVFFLAFLFGGRTAPNGMDFVGFMATGMCPFLLFRQTATALSNAVSANQSLLFYPQVFPIDLLISRTILEATSMSIVFMLIMGINAIFRGQLHVDQPLMVFIGFTMASLLGAALGTTLHGLTLYLPSLPKLVTPVLRLMFWTSGIFFSSAELPTDFARVLQWNPCLHVVEILRSGWYAGYQAPIANPMYVIYWIVALGFFGLLLERTTRHRIGL